MNRRDFLKATAVAPFLLGARVGAEPQRIPWSVVGDVSAGAARVAAGGLEKGTLIVEWQGGRGFGEAVGNKAVYETDFTAQAGLVGLPDGATISYQARLGSSSIEGSFRTPPSSPDQPVTFLWGGDVVGQGWGIDPAHGGMLTFQSMAAEDAHFFLHAGDSIYADDPIPYVRKGPNGFVWRNLITPAKLKRASTLHDFYGCYRYNFLDPHYRDFFSKTSVVAQWDDHEVTNNWDPVNHRDLAGQAYRAFTTYWPIRLQNSRLYRKFSYGPNVDVFVLDLRSHRAPNGENRQPEPGPETALLGREQLDWLKQGLLESRATWKVVAGEMPIATYGAWGLDSWANGPGQPLGREFEMAELLAFGLENDIRNVVWFSADVHYAAAYHFDPARASFKSFKPFWDFVAGPLHAGTFRPNPPDTTFGAELVFSGVPEGLALNQPPSANFQFYGKVVADSRRMTVSLHQRQGKEIYSVVLEPA